MATLASVESVARLALQRVREEMTALNLSQRDLADRLHMNQSRIAKILCERVELRLNDLAALARAVNLPLTEVVRDRGLEFVTEMTPTELRIFERLRKQPELLSAISLLVGIVLPAAPNKKTPKRGRPLNSRAS